MGLAALLLLTACFLCHSSELEGQYDSRLLSEASNDFLFGIVVGAYDENTVFISSNSSTSVYNRSINGNVWHKYPHDLVDDEGEVIGSVSGIDRIDDHLMALSDSNLGKVYIYSNLENSTWSLEDTIGPAYGEVTAEYLDLQWNTTNFMYQGLRAFSDGQLLISSIYNTTIDNYIRGIHIFTQSATGAWVEKEYFSDEYLPNSELTRQDAAAFGFGQTAAFIDDNNLLIGAANGTFAAGRCSCASAASWKAGRCWCLETQIALGYTAEAIVPVGATVALLLLGKVAAVPGANASANATVPYTPAVARTYAVAGGEWLAHSSGGGLALGAQALGCEVGVANSGHLAAGAATAGGAAVALWGSPGPNRTAGPYADGVLVRGHAPGPNRTATADACALLLESAGSWGTVSASALAFYEAAAGAGGGNGTTTAAPVYEAAPARPVLSLAAAGLADAGGGDLRAYRVLAGLGFAEPNGTAAGGGEVLAYRFAVPAEAASSGEGGATAAETTAAEEDAAAAAVALAPIYIAVIVLAVLLTAALCVVFCHRSENHSGGDDEGAGGAGGGAGRPHGLVRAKELGGWGTKGGGGGGAAGRYAVPPGKGGAAAAAAMGASGSRALWQLQAGGTGGGGAGPSPRPGGGATARRGGGRPRKGGTEFDDFRDL